MFKTKMLIDIENTLLLEKKLHPKAKLVDYYKLILQGMYGPAHLIVNKEHAFNYLEEELDSIKTEDFHSHKTLIQRIGINNDLLRVNLVLVKSNKIKIQNYFDAFYNTAKQLGNFILDEWVNAWHKIEPEFSRLGINFSDYTTQKNKIEELFYCGEYLVHHSEKYRNLYKPRYRVISSKLISEHIEMEG